MKAWLKRRLSRIPSSQYRQSFAKDYLDQRLDPFIGKRRGFYVEAGAHNGRAQSNTLYFETYLDWTGILIEPIPILAERCREARPNNIIENVALVADDSQSNIDVTYAGLMSTTTGAFREDHDYTVDQHHLRVREYFDFEESEIQKYNVPAATLSAVLEKHSITEIDLLSLDVEGYEEEALRGLDLEKHKPRYILVEERSGVQIEEMLQPHYKKTAILSFNVFYTDVLYHRIDG